MRLRPYSLFLLRLKQLWRELADSGPFYALLALAAFLIALYMAFRAVQLSYGMYLLAGVLLLLASIHFSRKDLGFVHQKLEVPKLLILFEYLGFAFPLVVVFVSAGEVLQAFTLVLSLLVLGFLPTPIRQEGAKAWVSSLADARDYEWIAGLRKSWHGLLLLLLTASSVCWLPYAPLVPLWLATTLVSTFYQECEPRAMLLASAGGSLDAFLWNKLRRHLKYLWIIQALPLILAFAFQPEHCWLWLAFLLWQASLLAMALFIKYGSYVPGRQLDGNSIILGMAQLGPLLPFFLPIPLIMAIRGYLNARSQLKPILHD